MLKTSAAAALAGLLLALTSPAQVFTLSRDQMQKFTAQWQGERFPDGRPKAPDALLERLKALSTSDVVTPASGLQRQFVDDLKNLNPGKKLVGRVVTLQLLPTRQDLAQAAQAEWRAKGNQGAPGHQTAIDALEKGDVMVMDAWGNVIPSGGIIGDNLAYYIWKTTGQGFVIDGAIRDLEGLSNIANDLGVTGFYRGATPTWIGGTVVGGINTPVRIGNTSVMPGDIVFGDRDGVDFIPAYQAEKAVADAEAAHAKKLQERQK
jgi:regulator of RNase E activity RraA